MRKKKDRFKWFRAYHRLRARALGKYVRFVVVGSSIRGTRRCKAFYYDSAKQARIAARRSRR